MAAGGDRSTSTTGQGKPGWPEGVESIALGGLGRLGIDRDSRLYWDGQRVEVRQRLSLTKMQAGFAIAAASAAVVVAVVEVLRAFGIAH